MSTKNISELLFERYLVQQGLTFEYEKEYPGKSKRVDYTVPIDGRDFLFEVKEFDPGTHPSSADFSCSDLYDPIRAKIDEAQKKFKEYAGFPCCLVLYRNGEFVIENAQSMFGAMYGEVGISIPVAAGQVTVAMPLPEPTFLDLDGKMLRHERHFNTRISALISIYEHRIGRLTWSHWHKGKDSIVPFITGPDESRVAVTVWENVNASTPFPGHVFRGPHDERWGLVGDCVRCKYAGDGA